MLASRRYPSIVARISFKLGRRNARAFPIEILVTSSIQNGCIGLAVLCNFNKVPIAIAIFDDRKAEIRILLCFTGVVFVPVGVPCIRMAPISNLTDHVTRRVKNKNIAPLIGGIFQVLFDRVAFVILEHGWQIRCNRVPSI